MATAWKKIYDEMKHIRDAGGATNDVVYQSPDNPNELTLSMEFPSIDAAKAFASSDALRSAQQAARVQGAPEVWFANRI